MKIILQNETELSHFVENELIDLSEFLCNFDNNLIFNDKENFYNLIASSQSFLTKIKFDTNKIKLLFFLLEISQRLGHRSNFIFLFKLIKDNGFVPNSRIIAASKYYAFGLDSNKLLLEFNEIHDNLQKALIEEQDNEKLIYTCFLDYYIHLVTNFSEYNPKVISDFKIKIQITLTNNPYSFLQHPIIDKVLKIDLTDVRKVVELINLELKKFDKHLYTKLEEKETFEIEQNTEYTNIIKTIKEININSFLETSKKLYKKINDDNIWESLNRGLAIIDSEPQLLAYMHSYGEMHYEKMKSSFEFINISEFLNKVEVNDWGCGQGLGSIYVFDQFKKANKLNLITNVNLIEPSTLAIKRAAFNLSNYLTNKLTVFNLYLNDFFNLKHNNKNNDNLIKIHIFSNILDIEEFSIKDLINYLKENYKGVNYFICTSPKLPPPKDFRFDYFIKEFSRSQSFQLLGRISQGRYEWRSDKIWTREICVFKVLIE